MGHKRSQSGATTLVEQRLLVPVAAAGAARRRRSSRGGRGEGGAYAGSSAGVRRTEARVRGDWREARGSCGPRILELGIQNVYKGKKFKMYIRVKNSQSKG
jgi:hypothetical protein